MEVLILVFLTLLLIAQYLFIFVKFKSDFMHPIFYFGYEYILKVILGIILFYSIRDTNNLIFLTTIIISVIYIVSLNFGFLISSRLKLITNSVIRIFNTNSANIYLKENYKSISFMLIVFFLINMAIVAFIGEGGLQWISDPRYAYQHFRKGVGIFYAFATISLFLSFLVSLFYSNRRIKYILATSLIFMFLTYFTGSKRTMLSILVFALVYWNYFLNKIRIYHMLIFIILVSMVFIVSFSLNYETFSLHRVLEYFNYFESMQKIVEKFNGEEEHYLGEVMFSNIWHYVPRFLYEDKPAFYGGTYITHILYPGSAEKGHFVGSLEWGASYIDFGIFGVIINGLISGSIVRIVYDAFIKSKSFFGLILILQVCYTPIFKYFSPSAAFVLFLVLIALLRIRMRN